MCLGVPGQVVAVVDADTDAVCVSLSGVRRTINAACVLDGDNIQQLIGCWVIVHAGFALERLDEAAAQHTLQLLAELGEL